jgi:hypothetical protein
MDLFFLITNISFYKYLHLNEFINIFKINKSLKGLDTFKYDYMWRYYCDLKFNSKFWNDAIRLNRERSLGSWKFEYIRIIDFENKLIEYGFPKWKIGNYYDWWNICKRIEKSK